MLIVSPSRHKGFRRVIRDQAPIGSKPSSNDNDSMKPNIGEDVRSRSPRGRPPIPGSAQEPRKRIDDIGKLTLEQGHLTESSPGATKSSSPPSSPPKRGALSDPEFPEPPMDDNTRPARSCAHHAKTTFGNPLVARNDSDRERPPTTDPDFARNSLGSTKRLFDPERDSPFSNRAVGKNKRLEDFQVHINHGAAVFVDSENYRVQPNPKPGPNDPYQGCEVEEDPTRHPNGPGNTRSDRRNQSATSSTPSSDMDQDQASDTDPILLLQPETRPISHDQLVVEVKGIYAGLVMVESKCMDVDEKQLNAALEKDKSLQTRLSNEQWQALIHLHKTLLHEHHDFFLASQHPSASPALSHLASKCSMPSRMWQRAIYAFLEVLRHRLPESRDHMLAFINIAYSMMALLYETVPAFEDTWIECLGDLARYRMAVEADDPEDREVWSGVARFWYDKATDHNPNTGRLYHHSAILARQYSLQQLSLFTRSLTCFTPFESAREGIKSLFNGVLNGKALINPRSSSFETVFIKAHGTLYSGLPAFQFYDTVRQMKSGLLDSYIGRVTSKFKEQGVYAMLTNIGALFEYGVLRVNNLAKSIFRLAYEEARHLKMTSGNSASQSSGDNVFDLNYQAKENCQASSPPIDSTTESLTTKEVESSVNTISLASELTFTILTISLRRIGDGNVYPLVHVALVFLFSLANVDKAMKYVEKDIPWSDICSFLNALARPEVLTAKIWSKEFPKPENGVGRPLPEDFAMRGQMYTQSFFPENWFSNAMINDEERLMEFPSLAAPRVERILWLGARIAAVRAFPLLSAGSRTTANMR